VSADGTADRSGGGLRSVPKVRSALTRYRVMAWLTGIGLVVLVLVGMPQKYLGWFGGGDGTVEVVGVAHGWLYVLLLITTFDLGNRLRWSWGRMLLTALAGTIPFLSFYAERRNTRHAQAHLDARRAPRATA
jgi:integral membrane protein